MKTKYELENERAIAGGGRDGWEARERIKRHRIERVDESEKENRL